MESLKRAAVFLYDKILEFAGTNFGQIQFESRAWAVCAAAALVVALLLKLIFFRRKHYRAHSGHDIPRRFRSFPLIRVLRIVTMVTVAVGTALLVFALANPFLPRVKTLEIIQSRERVDLVDVSASMGFRFQQTEMSAGEVARMAHLKLLSLRMGKNDRVSLWLFTDNPYKVEDFIVDDEAYFFQVFDAPYVIKSPQTWESETIAPKEKVRHISGEGSTNLSEALRAVIKYFDQESTPGQIKKSLLIITDAEVNQYPELELNDLKTRKIAPYILFVNQGDLNNDHWQKLNAEKLIKEISSFGGKYYNATNEKELEQAVRDIDRMEKVSVEVEKYASRLYIFQRFLAAGLALLLLGTLFGLFLEMLLPQYP